MCDRRAWMLRETGARFIQEYGVPRRGGRQDAPGGGGGAAAALHWDRDACQKYAQEQVHEAAMMAWNRFCAPTHITRHVWHEALPWLHVEGHLHVPSTQRDEHAGRESGHEAQRGARAGGPDPLGTWKSTSATSKECRLHRCSSNSILCEAESGHVSVDPHPDFGAVFPTPLVDRNRVDPSSRQSVKGVPRAPRRVSEFSRDEGIRATWRRTRECDNATKSVRRWGGYPSWRRRSSPSLWVLVTGMSNTAR